MDSMPSSQDDVPHGTMPQGGDDMPKEGMDKDRNMVSLSANHFPPGVKPVAGARLTFCVEGEPDEEGNVMGYFEAGKGDGKNPSEGMDDWSKDFRKSMSPSAKPEGMEAM